MTFQLRTGARLYHLHGSVGLRDWDMDNELKLATTTDQFCHDDGLRYEHMAQRGPVGADTSVKPNPWLLVNPNIVCPIQSRANAADLPTLCEPAEEQTVLLDPAETQHQLSTELHMSVPDDSCVSLSTEDMDSKTQKPGCWPRPPVNYHTLISLALKSSCTGSLKVQQIYHFIREHFPFFQTAPDGWKNNIRHSLCYNNSFHKTCNQFHRDGSRKSSFWHLTPDGHHRLKDKICTLTKESFNQLERSMSHPDVIRSYLKL